ncbi:MAG: dephospho-CoA kinase [Verrucomicrobia bacterium]|nr:MAG: dephospho-CoA kinase [Verrucomicrobiota bacterium]
MPSIAITGGIATGKSIATQFLSKKLKTIAFDADQEVSHLLDHDPGVIEEIISKFGPTIYDGQKKANRVILRALLIEHPESKKKLEEILYPRLRAQWTPLALKAKGKTQPLFLAEIPLLYENNLIDYFDEVIVVAASEQTALQRLSSHKGLSTANALALIQLQSPLIEKIKRAPRVLWNDGSITILEEQLNLLFFTILQRQHLLLPS